MLRRQAPVDTFVPPRLGHPPGLTDIRLDPKFSEKFFWARPNLYYLPIDGSTSDLDASRPIVLPLYPRIAGGQKSDRLICTSWPSEPKPSEMDNPESGDWFTVIRQHVGPDVKNARGVWSNIWNAVLVPSSRVEGPTAQYEHHNGKYPFYVAYTNDIWTGHTGPHLALKLNPTSS